MSDFEIPGANTGGGTGDVVGPASATDNAIARFDTTTGKLIQNSIVTIGDTGAIANTIANTSNVVGLTITQNDTTNNPNAVNILNSGTGNALKITPTGNTGTSSSVSGAILLDNTSNPGVGANFYSNNAAVGAAGIIYSKMDNAASSGPIMRLDNDGTGPAIKINANGNTGTGNSTSGAILIDNTNNTGFGFNLYSNVGAAAGPLAVIQAANAAFDQTALQIYQYGTSGAAAAIRMDGPSPQIEMVETDQVAPAGKFELQVQGDRFFINGRNSADNAFESIAVFDRLGSAQVGRASFAGPVVPFVTDGSPLGTTSLQFSDLFLAEGGVINWDNGDMTITQASNVMTIAGGNVLNNNFVSSFTTTATAAGTTTLTVDSTRFQFFTGSTTQTVVLPVASTLTTGHSFFIKNNSSGVVTCNSSGANLVATIAPGATLEVTCILASGTSAASWNANILAIFYAGGKTLAVNNTLTFAGTDNTTMTFPSVDATVAGIATTQTITNKRIQPRTASSTTSSNLSPDLSTANVYFRTTQTATLTIDAPTGTPVIGETIMIYVDSAGAQTLTINSTYKAFGAAFPATTTAGKTFMMSAQYNGTDWKTLWANAV